MAYELIPGVRQDHRGARYFFARYPNGKLIHIQALGADALRALEPARMIPIREHSGRPEAARCEQQEARDNESPANNGGRVRTGTTSI